VRSSGAWGLKAPQGLRADKKTPASTEAHADRDAQIGYINEQCKKANAEGIPVISIDAKKKANIGNFKNNGKTHQPQGDPTKVTREGHAARRVQRFQKPRFCKKL
jgi:hypothetical protein